MRCDVITGTPYLMHRHHTPRQSDITRATAYPGNSIAPHRVPASLRVVPQSGTPYHPLCPSSRRNSFIRVTTCSGVDEGLGNCITFRPPT